MLLLLADVPYVEGTMCAGGKNGTSNDHVIDEIHNTLMSYIHEQPCTWAPIISSVSVLRSGLPTLRSA